MQKKIAQQIYPALVYMFLYAPIFVVIIFSFNNASRSLVWKGFTLAWYAELFRDSNILIAAGNSLIVAALASSAATIVGTVTAVSLFRYRFFGKQVIHGLLFIMIITPEIVMGISLLLLYSAVRLPLGFWSLLFGHITLCLPFVAITVLSRVTTLDKSIIEAARDLGASDSIIFNKILIPLLLPSIAAAWLLSFTLSLDDVIISYFTTGPGFNILPLKIFSMVRLGVNTEINALCTLLLIATLAAILLAQAALRKNHAYDKD